MSKEKTRNEKDGERELNRLQPTIREIGELEELNINL